MSHREVLPYFLIPESAGSHTYNHKSWATLLDSTFHNIVPLQCRVAIPKETHPTPTSVKAGHEMTIK